MRVFAIVLALSLCGCDIGKYLGNPGTRVVFPAKLIGVDSNEPVSIDSSRDSMLTYEYDGDSGRLEYRGDASSVVRTRGEQALLLEGQRLDAVDRLAQRVDNLILMLGARGTAPPDSSGSATVESFTPLEQRFSELWDRVQEKLQGIEGKLRERLDQIETKLEE